MKEIGSWIGFWNHVSTSISCLTNHDGKSCNIFLDCTTFIPKWHIFQWHFSSDVYSCQTFILTTFQGGRSWGLGGGALAPHLLLGIYLVNFGNFLKICFSLFTIAPPIKNLLPPTLYATRGRRTNNPASLS